MEALALEIHQSAEGRISTEDLESWLDEWLYANPAIQSAYNNINRETLKKDLRTATFIVREQEKEFCFAHTPLQEYFLARHIINELANRNFDVDNIQGLVMPFPSKETIDFAVMMLETETGKKAICLKNMETIFETGYKTRASELCLSQWQAMHDRGMDTPGPKVIHLEGADLQERDIHGLDLSHGIFDNANMRKARLSNVQLTASTFKSTDLWNVEVLNCRMPDTQFTHASLQGSMWKDNNLSCSKWQGSLTHLADFVRCDLTGSAGIEPGSGVNFFLCRGMEDTQIPEDLHIDMFAGHTDYVMFCAISPDNRLIVSTSWDKTLKIWEIKSGKCLKNLAVLPQHETAAWDGEGRRLLSSSAGAWRWIGLSSGIKRFPIEAILA